VEVIWLSHLALLGDLIFRCAATDRATDVAGTTALRNSECERDNGHILGAYTAGVLAICGLALDALTDDATISVYSRIWTDVASACFTLVLRPLSRWSRAHLHGRSNGLELRQTCLRRLQ
jgi:hypothetical protein